MAKARTRKPRNAIGAVAANGAFARCPCPIGELPIGCAVQLANVPAKRFRADCWFLVTMRIGPEPYHFGVRPLDTAPTDPRWSEGPEGEFTWIVRPDQIATAGMWPVRRQLTIDDAIDAHRGIPDPMTPTVRKVTP